MNYELAKELKDAGFPREIVRFCRHPDEAHPYCRTERADCRNEVISAPTLEELIEACGEPFLLIRRIENDGWIAGREEGTEGVFGSTAVEAVARLWLALNKKS